MSIIFLLLITLLIPAVQLARPVIQLTFTPNEKYLPRNQQVEIKCDLINPNQRTDSVQLWHIDFKTRARTSISRSLLTSPNEDAPEVFKSNRNKRYEFVRKNHIRIRNLQMEDSAEYECNCPDCEDLVEKKSQELRVMQLNDPEWKIESGWPLHENTKAVIKCETNEFYPYVSHRILRDHQEITKDGRSSLSSDKEFPQKLIWEATVTPTDEWHNSTLSCSVTEGSFERNTTKTLDVLFAARFDKCHDRQHVDATKNQSTIECSYAGNPEPQLTWLRRSDQKPLTNDYGVRAEIKREDHGKYKSIITFDRTRLATLPLPVNPQENPSGENYYERLLNKGFLVKLTVNGNEKAERMINIVRDASQIRSNTLNHSIRLCFSSMFFVILFFLHIVLLLLQR